MKSVFLGDENNIRQVYTREITERLTDIAGLNPDVLTKAMLLSGTVGAEEIEYIFSTWGMPTLTEEEIRSQLPRLKAVFYAAGSVQSFAQPFLNCGVKVFSAWAANAIPVAEYTVAQIVLANKGFYRLSRIASAGKFVEARDDIHNYPGNLGARIGIIGAGMIGKLVIEMLKAYEFHILVFDPFLPEDKARELGVEKASLERIFTECDVVSNHLANNAQTERMLGEKLFSFMKPYATFLNTGRGAQVVESELISVLKKRNDLTAVLDVTYPEPPVSNSVLFEVANCVLTPHIAGSTGNEIHRMAKYMLEEFENHSQNKSCRFEVTLKMLETMA